MSQVLTFDYLGALAVSLLFPLLLAPKLGLVRTGILFGLINALRGAVGDLAVPGSARQRLGALRGACRWPCWRRWCRGLFGAEQITQAAEENLYADEIILSRNHALPAHRR